MLAALCLPVQNEMVPVGGTAFVTGVLHCQHTWTPSSYITLLMNKLQPKTLPRGKYLLSTDLTDCL